MNNEYEKMLQEHNSQIISQEDTEQQLKEQEEFLKNMGHNLDQKLSKDDLDNLDVRTRNKVLHLELLEKQNKELIDLQNSNATEKQIEALRLRHYKQEDKLFKKLNSLENISANEMIKIQAKKYITVKEFTEIYNMSSTTQQNRRGRLHDPLPYHQNVEGGKIAYVVEEVEKWFENGNK